MSAELDELLADAEDREAEAALSVERYKLLLAQLQPCRFPRLHWLLRLRIRWALRQAEYDQLADARAWAAYQAAAARENTLRLV